MTNTTHIPCAVDKCTQPGYWQVMLFGIAVSPTGDAWRQLPQQRGPYYCMAHGDERFLSMYPPLEQRLTGSQT